MGKKKGSGKNKPEKELTKAQRIEQKKAKQVAKSLKKDKKQQEEEDIEVILQEFLKKDAMKTAITIESTTQPSPRANFSMSMLPNGEIILFGGEYYDGDVNLCYNDVLKWNMDKDISITTGIEATEIENEEIKQNWKLISSPNTPPPRCSHQAAVFRDHLYIFGGEFATADQFHHYNDLWRLNLKTNAWEAITEKGGPSPRSGHRMVLWRNYLVVFGGFYEAARETRWFQDLYLFSLVEQKWRKVRYLPHRAIPAPRSGCQLAVHPSKDLIFLYGGYAKVKEVGEKAQGKVFSDLWLLDMAPILKNHEPTWEKLSRKGSPPSPRSGASVVCHKQRFILFGGVHDEEKKRHIMESTFFNDLFVYDMDRRRWFEFRLRGKASKSKRRRKKNNANDTHIEYEDDEEKEEEEEDDFERMLESQFGYVDTDGNIVYIDEGMEDQDTATYQQDTQRRDDLYVSDEETKEDRTAFLSTIPHEFHEIEETKGEENNHINLSCHPLEQHSDANDEENQEIPPTPCPRINPGLLIKGSTLFVYGGVVEDGDREITLDDCWSLDLKHLDEWNQILPGTMSEQIWKGEVSETEEDSTEFGEESDDEEDDIELESLTEDVTVERAVAMLQSEHNDDSQLGEVNASSSKKSTKHGKKKDRRSIRAEMEKLQEQLNLHDVQTTPQMGENLRDFFARTDSYWASIIAEQSSTAERQLSVKEIKREGFALAESRYLSLLPILEKLNALEIEQKEAEEAHLLKRKAGHDKARRG